MRIVFYVSARVKRKSKQKSKQKNVNELLWLRWQRRWLQRKDEEEGKYNRRQWLKRQLVVVLDVFQVILTQYKQNEKRISST